MEIEAPSPELAAATAEHEKVLTDATHQHYDGFRRGDKAADAYVSELYTKALSHPAAPPSSVPVTIGEPEGVSATTDLTDEMRAQVDVEVELRMELGDTYDTVMQNMATGAQYLFAGDDGQQALTALSGRIADLGPKAEVLGVKFLSDLASLQSQGGMRS